jgi:plasmid maintenance system antidote protein VapI
VRKKNRNAASKWVPEWVQKALEHADIKQVDLSRALNHPDRSIVNKMVHGTRSLSAEEMVEVSRITGYAIPDRRIGTRLE